MDSSNQTRKRKRRDYRTSDPESSAVVPNYFKTVLKNTHDGGYWVLFHYDDGSYYLLPPTSISADIILPQYRFIDAFKGKEIMADGMKVRVYWDTAHPVGKATVISVDTDQARVNMLFTTLEQTAKERAAKNKAVSLESGDESRMESFVNEESETEGSQMSNRLTRVMFPAAQSTEREGVNESGKEEEEQIDAADFDDDTYNIDNDPDNRKRGGFADVDDEGDSIDGSRSLHGGGTVSADDTPSYSEEELAEFRAKRDEHRKELQKFEALLKKTGEIAAIRKPKLAVPFVNWSFLPKDTRAVDRRVFQRLDIHGSKKCDIWVKQSLFKEAVKKAKDMDSYAQKLMWKALISEEELIEVAKLKIKCVGFAKLFGTGNFDAFYAN
ncbi:hypothetical protein RvY_08458 [Ramazzottius varieornatus]|uniref:Uncharacterized protein n=1 Tax=Ramazzottius varieornatus TaxID=947166 RepID=A0A1D1V8J6_RAMVA|nr:hypothetical protein RvY_08458 [Ramazzottius varieornatus]